MFEGLVHDVQSQQTVGQKTICVHLTWVDERGRDREGNYFSDEIGAIETWLAQPKPPTARERAESVARYMHEHGLLTHISGLEYSVAVDKIVTELEAAEAAAREAKSVNSPD